jgi:hypothetical protein
VTSVATVGRDRHIGQCVGTMASQPETSRCGTRSQGGTRGGDVLDAARKQGVGRWPDDIVTQGVMDRRVALVSGLAAELWRAGPVLGSSRRKRVVGHHSRLAVATKVL